MSDSGFTTEGPVQTRTRRWGAISLRALLWLSAAAAFGYLAWQSAGQQPEPIQQAYILALMLGTAGVLAFATGRVSVALLVSGGLFYGLAFVAAEKFRYLQWPLLVSDFYYYANASLLSTLGQYPDLWTLGLGGVLAALLLLALLWWLDRPLRGGWRERVGGMLACGAAIWLCMQPWGVFASVYNTPMWEKLSGAAHLTQFFVTAQEMSPVLPPMASAERAQADWGSSVAPRTAERPAQRPDIVLVLEESTFDPAGYADCILLSCRLSMFRPDRQTRAHGVLRTHTFGGGTWTSEFAALTGLPHSVFGPAGTYAPFVLAPRMRNSLPMMLRRQGYTTIAIYPLGGNFVGARDAYRDYGFDQFHDIHDLRLTPWHASDDQLFHAAESIYQKEKAKSGDQPVFMMILTLAQHGPHDGQALKSLPSPFNQGLLPLLSPSLQLNLSTYLAYLRASDEAMERFEQRLLQRPQPTVLAHFGDHQPSFGGLFQGLQHTVPPGAQYRRDRLTYYMIKSNLDGPALPQYPELDIAYLPAQLLQVAQLPPDSYFAALQTLQVRCQGLYVDCPYPSLLESYHRWVFDRLRVFE